MQVGCGWQRTVSGAPWIPACAGMTDVLVPRAGGEYFSAALGWVTGFDPVSLAALVLEGVFVAHGRQLTDDARRGVSGKARAVGDNLGGFVRQEVGDGVPALEPDRARQVSPPVGLFREHFQQDEIIAAVDLLFQVFATDGLHDAPF